jgi:RNA recognition motif-containing protein
MSDERKSPPLEPRSDCDALCKSMFATKSKSNKVQEIHHFPEKVFARRDQEILDPQLRKIFVGGLPHNLSLAQFRRYFGQFGDIEDIVILKDTKTLRPRGFGFVTYTDIRSVNTVLKLRDEHQIEGKWIDVKSAVPAD